MALAVRGAEAAARGEDLSSAAVTDEMLRHGAGTPSYPAWSEAVSLRSEPGPLPRRAPVKFALTVVHWRRNTILCRSVGTYQSEPHFVVADTSSSVSAYAFRQ